MHFSSLIVAAASLASVAVAQTDSGNPNMITNIGITQKQLEAGKTYTVEWVNQQGSSVTVSLRHGNPNALDKGTVLCGTVANSGKCTFTLPSDWQNDGKNTIEICQGSSSTQCNYSPMFQVSGASDKAASASGTAATVTNDKATESSEPTATLSGNPTAAETITGTSTLSTLRSTQSSYETESALPTETDAAATETTATSKPKSTGSTGNAPSPNEGSVARSSSLAMALCVFAAVVYLN